MNDNRALLLFVRNPEKGKVKTRLAQDLGDDKALAIYLELLDITRTVAVAIPAERLLFYSNFIPENDDWPEAHFQKHLQSNGDLGARMEAAFESPGNPSKSGNCWQRLPRTQPRNHRTGIYTTRGLRRRFRPCQ